MKVTVRTRPPKNGKQKLFLDIYDPKAAKERTSKTLDLFLYVNPTRAQAKINKEVLEAAENIRSKMTVERAYENNSLGELNPRDHANVGFLSYFQKLTDDRYNSSGNYGNWDSVLKHLKKFCPKDIPINQVDAKWLANYCS